MMHKKTLLIAFAIIAFAISSMAQSTRMLTAEKHNEYGIVYSIPKTAFRIDVTARKQTNIAGDFFQYARKYLGTDKVTTQNSEEWTITSVNVYPYGVTDNNKQYLMQLRPGSTTSIGVAEDGMLLSINCQPERSVLPSAPTSSRPDCKATGKEYLQYVNEDFLASQSKAKQAEMLFESLMEVREAYRSLTRGTADNMPTDGRQLELMLNSLQQQEKALTEAFTGISYETEESRSYTFLPTNEERKTLFRLSSFAGFTGADDYSGDPVSISVKAIRKGKLPKDANGVEKKFPKDGVVYCIPGAGRLSLTFKGEEIFSGDFEMAQYGVEFGLNPQLFSIKRNPSYAIFSDVTGGLLEIGNVSDLPEGGKRTIEKSVTLPSTELFGNQEPEEEVVVVEELESNSSGQLEPEEEVEAESEEEEE